jgi:ubiquilin
MADDTPMDSAPVTFNVKSSSDAKYTLTVPLSMTVLELKQNLSTQEYAAIEPERQRLIYSGRVLKDHETIDSYKIKEGHTIHLVKGAASSQRQNPASQGPISTPTPSGVPTNIAAGTGNNPLAGLTGARYAGFAQLPNQNMFGPDGGVSTHLSNLETQFIPQAKSQN